MGSPKGLAERLSKPSKVKKSKCGIVRRNLEKIIEARDEGKEWSFIAAEVSAEFDIELNETTLRQYVSRLKKERKPVNFTRNTMPPSHSLAIARAASGNSNSASTQNARSGEVQKKDVVVQITPDRPR